MIKLEADPVLLIYFANTLTPQQIADKTGNLYSTPIPIYLSEKLTGLYVDSEKKGLSISTENIVEIDKTTKNRSGLKVQQKGETQTTDISIVGRRDSVGLNLLLPMLQTIYDQVLATKDYRLAYFHNNVLIFNARLANLSINQNRDNNLVTIELSLEVAPTQEKEAEEPIKKLGVGSKNVPTLAGA